MKESRSVHLVVAAFAVSALLIGCAGAPVQKDSSGVSTVVSPPGEKTIEVRVAQGILTPAFKIEATLVTWEDRKAEIVTRMRRERSTDQEIETACDLAKNEFEKVITFTMRATSSKLLYSSKAAQQRSQDIVKRSMEMAAEYQKAYQEGGTKQPPSLEKMKSSEGTPMAWNGDTYLLIDEKGVRHPLFRIDNPLGPKVNAFARCAGCDNYFYDYRVHFKNEPGLLEPMTRQLTMAVVSEAQGDNMATTAYNLDLTWQEVGRTYYGSK